MIFADDHELTPEEKWNRATIANNFIFYKVMRNNPDVCRELLEILLEIEIERIEMYSEEEIEIDWESKGIRLDVYAKNESQAFNIEMQAADTKELPERARYYQGIIDVDTLKSGQKYKELKDSYIIFICLSDIFNEGLPLYTFEHLCRQNTTISMKDRAYKYFFIASNCDKILDERQRAFLNLVIGKKSSDAFTRKIAGLTEEAKKNIQWKRQYMEWERQRVYDYEDGKAAGMELGMEAGKEAKAREAAIGLFENGVSVEIIAKSLKLTEEKVREIIEQNVTVKA